MQGAYWRQVIVYGKTLTPVVRERGQRMPDVKDLSVVKALLGIEPRGCCQNTTDNRALRSLAIRPT